MSHVEVFDMLLILGVLIFAKEIYKEIQVHVNQSLKLA